MNWHRLINLPVEWILRSPLHRPLSNSILLMNVHSRKSGRDFVLPVNYVTIGNEILIVSRQGRTWWKNLVGGALVDLRIEGDNFVGQADVLTDPDEKVDAFLDLIRRSPQYCKRLGIVLTPTGNPANPEVLLKVVDDRILIWLSDLRAVDEFDSHHNFQPIQGRAHTTDQAV